MTGYLKKHEAFIKEQLLVRDTNYDWKKLAEFHKQRIEFMQHERLIHLLVTLAFAIFLFIMLGIVVNHPNLEFLILTFLLLCLLIPYVWHYFVLENGVQRWYKLLDEIEKRII